MSDGAHELDDTAHDPDDPAPGPRGRNGARYPANGSRYPAPPESAPRNGSRYPANGSRYPAPPPPPDPSPSPASPDQANGMPYAPGRSPFDGDSLPDLSDLPRLNGAPFGLNNPNRGSGPAVPPQRGGPKGGRRLPPGVSPDIFGRSTPAPPGANPRSAPLPPVPQPAQTWRLEGRAERRNPPVAPVGPAGEDDGEPGAGRLDLGPEPVRRRRGRGLVITLVLLVLALVLAYVVPAIVMSGMLLPGTTVNGVDIGGLTAAQAADRLREKLDARARQPILVQAMGVRRQVLPEDAGLSLDVVGTIEQAPSGLPTPAEVWRGLFGTTPITPKVDVQPAKLVGAVETLAGEIDRSVREGEIHYKGLTPEVVTPRDGRAVERDAAAEVIRRAYLTTTEPVQLPVSVLKPRLTAEAFEDAVVTARRAVAAPFTLTSGTKRVQLPRTTLAAHLRFVPDEQGRLVPKFDAKSALAELEKHLVDPAKAPVEPTYDIVNGKPKLIPGRAGQGVDAEKLAAAVAETIQDGGRRTIEVTLTTVKPRISESEVRALGIKEQISSFTTHHPCCAPRVTNIHTIADILDGYLVKPGETFSLNEIVGQRDKARGFVEAPQITAGRLVNEVGGGISQFVTTMYNAVFFGGLKDVKHTAHEFYISRYPAGRESTVSYPQPDFQWQNDSKYGVLIKTSYTDTSITVTFWSTKRYDEIKAITSKPHSFTDFPSETDDSPDCIPMVGQRGFTIEVTRVFYKDGAEVKRDPTIRTVYRPETNLTCTNQSGTTRR
ncbi:vancomycin resistance protein YoaR [Thermocatellispora tengchongensis]|uniref:Vancomycin resistance protein YoaR n=1 Tax=Thermocatellispora tengchongensis TaxID=1073253 RepID=A0A840NUX9_9ACTN|nr:VanW family protein [Thermocatellispora tengchongensis]MBB5132574.1 vancomycin resistance protein YoaR [Thermocatellispora tengchongensis]